MLQVRPGRSQSASHSKPTPQTTVPLPFSAPIGGLTTNYDISAEQPGVCSVLQNCYPTLTGARIRGGSSKYGLTADGLIIASGFVYRFGSTQKMFFSTLTSIYEMTSPATPPATTAASLAGLTSGDWATLQFTNTGGSYLLGANGADAVVAYDGTTWTNPAITFPDATTPSQINFMWPFKTRLFLLKNESMDAYYLGTAAIAGAAALFPLGGVMKKGGRLLMGFDWSIESGDGLSNKCVFVSTEGEVAVYAGTDPTSAATFALENIYQIGKPLGKNAYLKFGGDIWIATVDGLVPLSQVVTRDKQLSGLISISRPIEDQWRLAAAAVPFNWTITTWPERNLAFIAFPATVSLPNTCFVVNVLTQRWAIITGWQPTCFATVQGGIFFGTTGGYVMQAESTGADDGLTFTAAYLSQFYSGGQTGQRKSADLASLTLRGSGNPKPKLFARADGDTSVPNYSVVSTGAADTSLWDVGLWDVAVWDGISGVTEFKFRQDVRAAGDTLAQGCVVVSGGSVPLNIEIRQGNLQVGSGEASA